jgi:hypothetical protein
MKASVVTAYGGPEVLKCQDMPDPKPGAGDVLVRVAGIGINPEDMLERNGDTKDRYRSAACRFKNNDADVRADSRRSSRTPDEAKKQTFTATTLKYGSVALCYRLRGYSESVTRVTTRAPVLNYSALVNFLRTSTATAKCMIDEGYGRHTPCEALYDSKKCMIDERYGRYTPCGALVRQRMKGRA